MSGDIAEVLSLHPPTVLFTQQYYLCSSIIYATVLFTQQYYLTLVHSVIPSPSNSIIYAAVLFNTSPQSFVSNTFIYLFFVYHICDSDISFAIVQKPLDNSFINRGPPRINLGRGFWWGYTPRSTK